MTGYDDYGLPVGAYSEPEGLGRQAYRVARAFLLYRVKPVAERGIHQMRSGRWTWRSLFSLVRVLIVGWCFVVFWGERRLFANSVDACEWENWENWPAGANPHRLLFVADPQLVDPHTYPGRPWPLNTLTVKYTDLYMRRAYSRIQRVLYPDTVMFLGDLFDGGREWSTATSASPETRYRKYGDNFWLKEYNRFGTIFLDHWGDGGMIPRPGQPGKKIISTLPGNHDLGFGKGVQAGVRKRFHTYFGEGNRIDIIGNHTFVSIDSVSLSAMAQENSDSVQELWKPTLEFLDGSKKQKQRLIQRELRTMQGLRPNLPMSHEMIELDGLAKAQLPHFGEPVTEFPTVLLSHVPLYRAEGTPCGPMREHWPPTPPPKGQTEPLVKDNRNAISVSGGYQYQNVLLREITRDVADKVGNIQYAFSGDDHDYCEVVHRGYTSGGGGIKEITVKSISWAMGVRHPGVVLVSMWNPVDGRGNPLEKTDLPTLQTHLCLLPDQLGIFIRYALFFALTLLLLLVRAALIASGRVTVAQPVESPILPTTNEPEKPQGPYDPTSSNSSTSSDRGKLQVRNARTRSTSPSQGYGLPMTQSKYTYPLVQHAGFYGDEEDGKKEPKSWGTVSTKRSKPKKKGFALFAQEFRNSMTVVAGVVLSFYFWLIWNG
ncbi:hypothetical protein P154DRAFT_493753 [Amniculicola lignicola CBS 123094]|uniref:Uncharacterized protein n=1 Tax=Amniculicola lignicola CBS 123094 TaxID=1392246 RepID=A0A6A5WBP5_9PLEO|nr:hypothetical protein P154DRAFT_493753 [Amniculicola lignicola CBS 123094]